jgi:hypothetical protein
MSDQPERISDRWAKFTPDASGLDRDAILFAAGRQSARPLRLWPVLTMLLAVSQAVTLVVLWPRSIEPVRPEIASPPAIEPQPELVLPPSSAPTDVWRIGSPPEIVQSNPTAPTGEFVVSEPPLTVGSLHRFD